MATINNLHDAQAALTWNDVDAFDYTASVTIASGVSFLAIRMVGPDSAVDNLVLDGNNINASLAIQQGDGNAIGSYLYIVSAPAAGSVDIVLSDSSARSYQLSIDEISGAGAYEQVTSGTGYGTTRSLSFTTEAGDVVIDAASGQNGGLTATAGQTVNTANDGTYAMSHNVASGASTDLSWSLTAGQTSQVGAVFKDGAPAETLTTTNTDLTHGDVVPLTSSITDATSAKVIDSADNEIALTGFTDDGANAGNPALQDYSGTFPALSDGFTGLLPDDNWTIEITNGTDTATVTIPRAALAGHDEITVTTPAGTLTEDDWAYGLATPIDTGDIAWWPTTAGVTFNADGTVTIDAEVFTSGVITGWAQDITDRRWTRIQKTYEPESGSDVTDPTLSSAAGSATGETTASGSVSTDEDNGILYYLASENASESVATVKAGSSQAVSATGSQSVSVTGLTAGTLYYLHFVHTDAAGNDSDVATSAQFQTVAAQVGPVLSSPSLTAAGSISGTISTDTGTGTLYFVATENPTEEAATVKAGSSQAVSATGDQSITVSGLSEGVWYLHALHNDGSDDSAVLNVGKYIIGSGAGLTIDAPVKTLRAKTL